MEKKKVSIITASIITIVFLFFAMRPGIFNMIGYTISILIFPENSQENLKYGKLIIRLFNILCGGIIFWIVYKIMMRGKK
ncbi:MAG: hypothetical protein QM737_02670 [Ferruginibacter sp.]